MIRTDPPSLFISSLLQSPSTNRHPREQRSDRAALARVDLAHGGHAAEPGPADGDGRSAVGAARARAQLHADAGRIQAVQHVRLSCCDTPPFFFPSSIPDHTICDSKTEEVILTREGAWGRGHGATGRSPRSSLGSRSLLRGKEREERGHWMGKRQRQDRRKRGKLTLYAGRAGH